MTWLTNWNMRKQLYLNGTNTSQSSYQMKITIYYGSGIDTAGNIYCNNNCNTNFSDIRFTDTSGTTLLNYWIDPDNTTISSYATVWVNVPSIPTGNNSAYIYIYYGNSGATSLSNIKTTFIVGDDFPGTTLDATIWSNHVANGGVVSVSGGELTHSGDVNWWGANTYTKKTFSKLNSLIIEFRIRFPAAYSNGGNGHGIYLFNTSTVTWDETYYDQPNGAYIPLFAPDNVTFNTTWRVTLFGDGTYSLTLLAGDQYRSNVSNAAITNWSSISDPIVICFDDAIYQNHLVYYHNIRIRNYASPEPTWSSTISTEQGATLNITSNPTSAEIWLRTPAGSGSYIDQGVKTNTTINVAPGTYDIELILSGGQTWYLLNQNYIAGNTYNIPATFTGQLFISSTPTNAEVWLSGYDYHIQTNTTISGLNPSPPDYTIRLVLTGYQDWTGTVTVYSIQTANVIATFAGSVNITSSPSGAEVYLDGSLTPLGNTPLTIKNLTPATSDGSFPTLSHNYILKIAGYTDMSGSFIATAGSTINVPVTFPGSLNISSLPEGAEIYIDGILQ